MSCLINILLVPMKVLYQQITSRYLPVFYLQLNDVFKMKKNIQQKCHNYFENISDRHV